jgi:metal-sulfur cluster biosynthetic enzyme
MPPLAKQGEVEGPTSSAIQVIVTLTKGICVVNGVLYFKLSNAIEHVLTTKETSAKLQEWNYLGLSLPNYKSV